MPGASVITSTAAGPLALRVASWASRFSKWELRPGVSLRMAWIAWSFDRALRRHRESPGRKVVLPLAVSGCRGLQPKPRGVIWTAVRVVVQKDPPYGS